MLPHVVSPDLAFTSLTAYVDRPDVAVVFRTILARVFLVAGFAALLADSLSGLGLPVFVSSTFLRLLHLFLRSLLPARIISNNREKPPHKEN